MIIHGRRYDGLHTLKKKGDKIWKVQCYLSYHPRHRWEILWRPGWKCNEDNGVRWGDSPDWSMWYGSAFWKLPQEAQEYFIEVLTSNALIVPKDPPKWWVLLEEMKEAPLNDRVTIMRELRASGTKADRGRLYNILQWWKKCKLPDYEIMSTYGAQ